MDLLLLLQALAGLLLSVLLCNLCFSIAKLKKTNLPPEPPRSWPVVGHLHLLRGREPVARILGAMADKCGPAFMLRLGMRRALVVSSWELAKECFTTNDRFFATRPKSLASKILGYDYATMSVAPYGSYWREIRKKITLEVLSSRKIDSLKHVWENEIDMGIRDIYGMWVKSGNQPINVDMKRWFSDLTLNVMVMMVVGKRYVGAKVAGDEEEARRFHREISELFRLMGVFVVGDALPFLRWADVEGHEKAMKWTAKELDIIASKWLEEHRQRRAKSKVLKKDQDFMDVLISIMEDAEISHHHDPDTIIKAAALVVILAGSESSALTLIWALSLLMNKPQVLKQAQEELDLHVGKDRHVHESDIKNLLYLQAIVKETMRLYPAGPLSVPHEAMEDCYVGGFHIPAGTQLLTNIWKIQRDASVWLDPSEYKPERFLTSHAHVDARGQHFEFIPFGSGRRMCPGMAFANQVVQLTLARLIHGFDMSTPMGEAVDMTEGFGLTMPKEGPLQVLFSPRLSSQLFEH